MLIARPPGNGDARALPSRGFGRIGVGLGALALLVGLLIRVGVAASARLWFDEATTGLMSLHVLRGRFPFFFYGQSYMGAAEAYLHATCLAVFGPPADAVRVWPASLSLTHAALAGLLARRVFGAGAWASLFVLLPSPFLLKWAYDARLHYDLILVLTPLLLLLALRATDPDAAPSGRARALVTLGAVAGLSWWTNLLLGAPVAAAAVTVGLARRRVGRAAWGALLAFLLGSAPVWLFVWRYRRPPASQVPLATPAAALEHLHQLASNALPILVGVPSTWMGRPLGRALATGAVGLFVAGCAGALTDRRASRAGRVILGTLGALVVAAVVLTVQGADLTTEDPRYLLPLLAIQPVLLAGALARLGRSRPALATLAGLALLGLSLAAVAVEYPPLVSRAAWQARRARRAAVEQEVALLTARGLTAVYTHDADTMNLTFVSGERVAVSNFYFDADPLIGRRVDAAPEVAYLGVPPPGFEPSLAAAGIRFTRESGPLGPLYTGFALESGAVREIPPEGWVATAWPRPELAPGAVDRDGRTRWSTRRARQTGMWFAVDLGRPRRVAMLAWLPGAFEEVPTGFRVEASSDGRNWTTLREVPQYYGPLYWSGGHPMGRVRWGRAEVRFPPVAARHLRITHIGSDRRLWTVRELFVYDAAPEDPEAGDPSALALALRRAGILRVYADHALGARLTEASDGALVAPPDNVRVDPYGWSPAVNSLPALEGRPDRAVVVPSAAPEAQTVLDALRLAGWRVGRRNTPGFVVATGETEAARRREDLVVPGARPAPAGGLGLEWPEPVNVAGAELGPGAGQPGWLRETVVEIRRDIGWEPVTSTVRRVAPLVWAGTSVLEAGAARIVFRFPPARIRALRLVQGSAPESLRWPGATIRALAP